MNKYLKARNHFQYIIDYYYIPATVHIKSNRGGSSTGWSYYNDCYMNAGWNLSTRVRSVSVIKYIKYLQTVGPAMDVNICL